MKHFQTKQNLPSEARRTKHVLLHCEMRTSQYRIGRVRTKSPAVDTSELNLKGPKHLSRKSQTTKRIKQIQYPKKQFDQVSEHAAVLCMAIRKAVLDCKYSVSSWSFPSNSDGQQTPSSEAMSSLSVPVGSYFFHCLAGPTRTNLIANKRACAGNINSIEIHRQHVVEITKSNQGTGSAMALPMSCTGSSRMHRWTPSMETA